jgi:hypothetical protein
MQARRKIGGETEGGKTRNEGKGRKRDDESPDKVV